LTDKFMIESPSSYENLAEFLQVSGASPERINRIRDMLNKGHTLAFLVTPNFNIHIGTTGMHKDIPVRGEVMEKGRIVGSSKQITWETSDNNRSVEINSADLQKLRSAIRQKINNTLDLTFYLQ